MRWRSKERLSRPYWSMRRGLFKSMGYSDYDLDRPLIGIANSWNTVVSGHYNLKQVAQSVRRGIDQAGGTPVEFGVIGGCDGLADGGKSARYMLPSRSLIADSVEMMVEAHHLDGVVLLGSCDKIVPGMLMAAARLDLPSILIVGGPSPGGCRFDGRASDNTSLNEALPMLEAGTIDEETFRELEDNSMPGCGSCSMLGTANSMCCIAEAMGMSLPGSAVIPASQARRFQAAQATGRQIVSMVKKGLTARQIITPKSIENAIRVMAAIGGSTNVALHIPAIAYEACVDMDLDLFDSLSRATPWIARINPSGPADVSDFHDAGGVPAVMKEILPLLQGDALTVTGKTIAENVAMAGSKNSEIIRTLEDPWEFRGGLAVLRGNLAPEGSIAKPSAIDPLHRTFTGTAHCFDSEIDATRASGQGEIKPGTVVVVRYEGPRGGPGMPEMYLAMKLLYGQGLALRTALITDGRFSGSNNGCFVGHISPEASQGGPIALVRDKDTITIDIPNGNLTLHVSEKELQARREKWQPPEPKPEIQGYLNVYGRLAGSASKGAIITHRGESLND
ncbi:MAG: dihydroxy-acid dehydratase [Desulfotignum sp.]|nr:dihydroxy-acid dehydratase [Desulfotignum sp.]